jgi:hypothetical protein
MKPFLKLTALALALTAVIGLAGDTSDAAQAPRKKTQQGRPKRVQRVHGHRVMHPQRARSLRDGKHHVHTGRSGHRVHTALRGGKIHNVHVTDRSNRAVRVHKKFVRRAGRRAANPLVGDLIAQALAETDLAGEEFTATAQVPFGAQVFVVFTFQINGQTIMIFFPASSVVGGNNVDPNNVPVDPNIPDPDGGDDLNC